MERVKWLETYLQALGILLNLLRDWDPISNVAGLAASRVFDYGSNMPEQLKKTSQSRKTETPAVESPTSSASTSSTSKNLTAELDSLLDEIDEVLESNAEEFVKSYVQKGGQ